MDLGAIEAGCSVIFANDNMPESAETFTHYFPETEFKFADVADIRCFPNAEMVMGGYPCQSFSMGGNRRPGTDGRTQLYQEFARCVADVNPKFFIAENVAGLMKIQGGRWLSEQIELFAQLGKRGYNISWNAIKAQDYGIPQKRKRIIIVGVRKDLRLHYWFPPPTHGTGKDVLRYGLEPYESHGDAILGLPLWPKGEFYERPHDPEGHWSWYYMSRNRKAKWDGPSFTIVANFRHVTLHPASSTMRLVWSNLADGWKQKWEFSGEYEHLQDHAERPILEEPRRLSWRECAAIQTFPRGFEPAGNLEKKLEQIGNAVPPRLMKAIATPILDGTGLKKLPPAYSGTEEPDQDTNQLALAIGTT